MNAALSQLAIGDSPDAWERAGFVVDANTVRIGGVNLALVGDGGDRGVLSWGFADEAVVGTPAVDGLATHHSPKTEAATAAAPTHPNGAQQLDHLVVATPNLGRSIEAFENFGLELRRVRDTGTKERPTQQAFFWIGEPILELVGPKEPRGDAAASFYGIAVAVADLAQTAAYLGESCGTIKNAVQPGRQVATLRHQELGMSVPLIFMSPHLNASDRDA